MHEGLATVAYLGATILFVLSLGGLSNPETARRGNFFGMTGMAIAVLTTLALVLQGHVALILAAEMATVPALKATVRPAVCIVRPTAMALDTPWPISSR